MSAVGDRRRRATPEQRRELILRAAAEEFASRGHRDARLDDIARAAHCTRAAIYDHFSDKRHLHAEVLTRATHDTLQAVAVAVGPPDGDPRERYRRGVLASFKTLFERPDIRMLVLGSPGAPPEVTRVQEEGQRTLRKALAALYLSEPRFLANDPDREERAEEVAQGAMGALNALAILGMERGLSEEHLADVTVKLIWPGISAMQS